MSIPSTALILLLLLLVQSTTGLAQSGTPAAFKYLPSSIALENLRFPFGVDEKYRFDEIYHDDSMLISLYAAWEADSATTIKLSRDTILINHLDTYLQKKEGPYDYKVFVSDVSVIINSKSQTLSLKLYFKRDQQIRWFGDRYEWQLVYTNLPFTTDSSEMLVVDVQGNALHNHLVKFHFWGESNNYPPPQTDYGSEAMYFDSSTRLTFHMSSGILASLREQQKEQSQLRAVYNPVSNIIRVKGATAGKLTIYDAFGRLINTYEVLKNSPGLDLEVSELSQGFYYLCLGNTTVKIVIVR